MMLHLMLLSYFLGSLHALCFLKEVYSVKFRLLTTSTQRIFKATCGDFNNCCDIWEERIILTITFVVSFACFDLDTGDKSTLSVPNIRDRVIEFYNTHYCASRMKLVIQGDFDVSQMEHQVRSLFDRMEKRMIDPPSFSVLYLEGFFRVEGSVYC